MVLRTLLCLALLAGCKQSLFDAHGGDDDPTGDGGNGDGNGGGDGDVPSSCPAPCLADAAGDFGTTKWRYLDDNTNRSWTPMTMMSGAYTGQGSNRISRCMTEPSAAACTALPGALLVTTTGMGSPAPAVSYTSTMNQVIQISVRVHVPSTASAHTIRFYRNTREDVLFTAAANPGLTFERALTLDALNNDRFYVALDASTTGGELIGLHVYVNDAQMTFPIACQMAVSFTSASGNTVSNACGSAYTYTDYNTGPVAPMLAAGPIPDLGMAADIPMDRYYEGGTIANRSGDSTTQFWVKHDAFVSSYHAWPFSDLDLDDVGPGGVGVYIKNEAPPRIGAETCTSGNPLNFVYADAPFPDDHVWHFVRVIHAGGNVHICLDGSRVASYPLPAGAMQSKYKPFVGKNVRWLPVFAAFDGGIDDVRIFTGALPCDLPP